jgi:hypothetical protein
MALEGATTSSRAVDRRDAILAVTVAVLGTLLAIGAVLIWVGPAALLPPGPTAVGLETAFVLVGALGLGVLFGGFRQATGRALRSTVPHMFPFGSVPLDIACYVLVFAVVACSTHALFDVFTGADNGGQVEGLANQAALNLVLAAAYGVVYLSTMYAVFLIARVVRLGRSIDHHQHTDPYRTGQPAPAEAPDWVPSKGPAAPSSQYARPVLYVVSGIVGIGMSAAVQLFEVSLQPAAPMQWLAGQAFTPLWAVLTAWALAYLDTGTRTLEARYVAVVPPTAATRAGLGDAMA